MNTGFIAGTLVHTKNGLIPIQSLSIGDSVLSKNNNSLCYQEIINITQASDYIIYNNFSVTEGDNMGLYGFIFCSPNTKLWVNKFNDGSCLTTTEIGWLNAQQLEGTEHHCLQTFEEKTLAIMMFEFHLGEKNLLSSVDKKMAWFQDTSEIAGLIDFSSGIPRLSVYNNLSDDHILPNVELFEFKPNQQFANIDEFFEAPHEMSPYIDKIYNLTMKNSNNFFIGHEGIMVQGM